MRQQKKGKSLVLDDGRIEAMKEYLSPEELYQDLISRVLDTTRQMIFL